MPRLHAVISDTTDENLRHLAEEHDVSVTHVVRTAAALLRYIDDQQAAGATLRMVAPDGTATNVRIFM